MLSTTKYDGKYTGMSYSPLSGSGKTLEQLLNAEGMNLVIVSCSKKVHLFPSWKSVQGNVCIGGQPVRSHPSRSWLLRPENIKKITDTPEPVSQPKMVWNVFFILA